MCTWLFVVSSTACLLFKVAAVCTTGENLCGGAAHAPSVKDGWCDPFIRTDNANTEMPDASTLYMASGFLHSQDGREILLYYSGSTHTHGGIATPDAAKTWGNNVSSRYNDAR
eukprot:SAG31_NODE_4064_length_3624_cov_2.236312_5_plen_113_part_00